MEGLRFNEDGKAEVWGELRYLLGEGAVLSLVQGRTRQEAVPALLQQCKEWHSDGQQCDYTGGMMASGQHVYVDGSWALPRCACAAALAALHDIDSDEMNKAKLQMIAEAWGVEIG